MKVEQKGTNIALLIPFLLLSKAISGLGGLEFFQKMRICMLNLVVLITHFCLNLKYLQYSVCPAILMEDKTLHLLKQTL